MGLFSRLLRGTSVPSSESESESAQPAKTPVPSPTAVSYTTPYGIAVLDGACRLAIIHGWEPPPEQGVAAVKAVRYLREKWKGEGE